MKKKNQTLVTFIGDDEIGLICDQRDPYRFFVFFLKYAMNSVTGISVNVVYIHTQYVHTHIYAHHT